MDYKLVLKEFGDVVKSTAPLVLALITLKLILRSPFDSAKQLMLGMVFVLVGLFVFQKGVDMCLVPLGDDVGRSFTRMPARGVIIIVCLAIGFASTLVEPALRVIAKQAEEVTVGALRQNVLIYSTAIGCAVGMALGIAKVLYNLKSAYIIIPLLVLLLVLSFMSKDFVVGLAFDCASATTGPVNIPINSAIAIGLATVLEGVDPMRVGFGLVGLTCLGAAASVMLASVLKI